jgi:integrase
MRFDARTAKLLKPGEHLTIDDCPGLRLKATQSGHTWIYRFKSPIDALMRQTKIGAWPAVSLAAAVAKWELLRQARDAGRDPASEKRIERQDVRAAAERNRPDSALTVRQLCELYLVGHIEGNRKPKGAAEIRRMFNTMLGDFGNVQAASVTRSQAFETLESYSNVPVQASKLRAELGAAWDYGLDAGRLPETAANWWRQIMRGRLRSRGKVIQGKPIGTAKRVLSEPELGELIRWLPNFSRTVADSLALYMWTGTRGSEIMAMEASEISKESDGLWWTIPKAKTKNARHADATDLRVPLVGRAAEIVRRRLANVESGYLFPSQAEPGHVQQKVIQESVHFHQPYSRTKPESVRPRLTVTRWSPHDLRRSCRTLLAKMGCLDEIAEAVLGHMQPGVKGIYNLHSYDKERQEWLTRLSARLEELVAA